ncbi:MAG: inorganic pyrophosphatase [Candidatus Vogelbacteria bacterium CG10_big_fil_rev_8_21_14_0_10_45_14]|uniref:Inorganic pyrophosphatase n=1 Tax=Candidatus Vogelbacteria bacterium CG10_big_fil_rev_8_21_14_0_10_45_14 TaxID=1975042 RepID=A0A2H0RKW6_9BACT|nr:MAG: inorganic pyrophosphatase [Candidatus Vogelbacteria bacterium CG10_big_fil_rev_8_21_14_0_10_45_14]
MNLYKDIAPWSNEEKGEINMVVDVPRGGSNKYEYNEEKGYYSLNRVLFHQMFYPFDYGFIPQTHFDDGDAMDVMLLTTFPTFPGCVIRARVVGSLETKDEAGGDLKVLAVPIAKIDPRWNEIEKPEDVPAHVRSELELHFKEIKKLEKEKYDKVVIGDWKDREFTLSEIRRASTQFMSK